MNNANPELINRWNSVKTALTQNVNMQKGISKRIRDFYEKGSSNGKLGSGQDHIIFPQGPIKISKESELYLALKLNQSQPYSISNFREEVHEEIIEQVVGFDYEFIKGNEKFMPWFIGLISWGDNLALLTEDISHNRKELLVKPRRGLWEKFENTHCIRYKEGNKELFFVDPLFPGHKEPFKIFKEYLDKVFRLSEKLF